MKAGKYLERMDAALKEDILALENQHSGINCNDASLNIFHPLLEANLVNFSKWYQKNLAKPSNNGFKVFNTYL